LQHTGAARQDGNRLGQDDYTQERETELTEDTQNEPYFGDLPGKVRSHNMRIGSINLDNLATKLEDDKHERLFTAINNYKLDITLMQEVGVDWSAIARNNGWHARVKETLEHGQTKSYMGYNKQAISKNGVQWGGTGVMSYGKITHFASGAGQDKANLGRWTWTQYRGKDGMGLRVVSIYRPCGKEGNLTVNA
jgi:exonuclease III